MTPSFGRNSPCALRGTGGCRRLSSWRFSQRWSTASMKPSASRSPWIDANGWQILRAPARRYYYDVPAASVALAAAEAFHLRREGDIHTSTTGGAAIFQRSAAFLRAKYRSGTAHDGQHWRDRRRLRGYRRADEHAEPPQSPVTRIVTAPDPHLDLNIGWASKGVSEIRGCRPERASARRSAPN